MFRSVEQPYSPRARPGSQSSGEYESSEEEEPFCMKPKYSDPMLDLLSLRQFCSTDPDTGKTSIRLCGNELSQPRRGRYYDQDAALLVRQLAARRDITGVDFSYNWIGDAGARDIAACLRRGWRLERLNLMNNELGPAGALHLSAALAAGRYLTALRLNGNALGPQGGRHVAQLLGRPDCPLRELDMGETGQDVASLTALLNALRANSSLRRLVLDGPLLRDGSDEAAAQLGRALRVNTTLESLSLRKFGLCDDHVRLLCDGLAANGRLAELDLTANRLHRDGARHLAAALADNRRLRVLRLCHNRVQSEGAIRLARALADFGARDALHIRANDVHSDGLLALCDALARGQLRRLHLWGNPWCARVPAALDVLWKTGVVDERRVDVRPYVVDYVPRLAELRQPDRCVYYNVAGYAGRSNDRARTGPVV